MEIISPNIKEYNKDWWENLYTHIPHESSLDEIYAFCVAQGMITDGSVIDVGCGEGYFSAYVQSQDYLGIDWSVVAIERAKKRFPNRNFIACNYEEYKPEKRFDFAVACEVFEHMEKPIDFVNKLFEFADNVVLTIPNGEHGRAVIENDKKNYVAKITNNKCDYHYAIYYADDIKKMFPGSKVIEHSKHLIILIYGKDKNN